MAVWYLGSTKWTAVTAWAATTVYSVGDLRRQLAAPAVNSERVFRCTTAGTSGGAEPSWTLTKGGTTSDGSAVWTEVTGDTAYGWTAAHARMNPALAWMAAGDTLYVSNNHAETGTAAITLTFPGTAAAPNEIICATDTATPPTAQATTATVTTTGNQVFSFAGFAYIQGITFATATTSPSQGFLSQSPWWFKFENCQLKLTSGSAARWKFGEKATGTDGEMIELVNTTFSFAASTQGIIFSCRVRWIDTPNAIVGTAPGTLFPLVSSGDTGDIYLRGIDLSAITGATNYLVDPSATGPNVVRFENCKLGASVSIFDPTNVPVDQGGTDVDVVNCDSADTNYRYNKIRYQGQIYHETTIVKLAGASDGTTNISRKMVTTANAKFVTPLVSDPIITWNDSVGALTATVEIVNDGSTLTDAEVWLEIEYLGTSGFPLASFASDSKTDVLASAANQTTSTVSWTTTGLTTPVKQKLAVSFTTAEKGPILARVCLAKASQTIYFDPKMTIA